MNAPRTGGRAVPVEEFLQAIGEQLDRAQDSLAVKAKTGRPLTWALRDLKVDLQVFVELDDRGRVLWRSASANESGASTVHLEFTTITRPMIEENTWSILDDSDPRSVDEIGTAADLSGDDRRRLERMGVRTVGQLRRLSAEANNPRAVEAMIGFPVGKLEAALRASARPAVTGQEVIRRDDETLLRIHGANLHDGINTEVRLGGDQVEIVEASPRHLLVRPLEHHRSGEIEVRTAGERAIGFYRIPVATAPSPSPRSGATIEEGGR
jgi:hypothetical protein